MLQSCTWPIRGTCICPLISVLKPPSSWSSSWKLIMSSKFTFIQNSAVIIFRDEFPEWFVRSESSSVLKLIPSAQQCWPEPNGHRDRSKDVNNVYCNIFHGVFAAPTKSFCDFRVTKKTSPCHKDNICDHRVTKHWEVRHLGANNPSHARSWVQHNNNELNKIQSLPW